MKHHPASGACSLADDIAVVETEAPFVLERVELSEERAETGNDFGTISPDGYVPTRAFDDGDILTENIAIWSEIADRSKRVSGNARNRWLRLQTLAFIPAEVRQELKPSSMPDMPMRRRRWRKTILQSIFAVSNDYSMGATMSSGPASRPPIAICMLC